MAISLFRQTVHRVASRTNSRVSRPQWHSSRNTVNLSQYKLKASAFGSQSGARLFGTKNLAELHSSDLVEISNILADNRPNDVIAAVDKLISEINSGSKKISSEELFAVYGFKADAFSLLGNSQGAIATLKEAISLGNAPADTYLNLADAYMSERQFSEVVTACDAALKLSENNGEAFYMKAAALLQMVSNDNAVEELQNVVSLAEKAIARDKYLTDAHLVKGVALLKLGNAADALKDIEKSLSQDPDNHYAAAQRGDALDHLLRWDDAIRAYSKAIELDKYKIDFLSRYKKAQSILVTEEENSAETALALLDEALDILTNIGAKYDQYKQDIDARLLVDHKQRDSAREHITVAKIEALDVLGRTDDVIALSQNLVGSDISKIQCLPASFFITYASARLAVGQDEPALQIAQKGLTYHPDDHVLLFTLARCLDKVGAVTKCEQVLQRCIELDPTEISYRIYRATVLLGLKRHEEAIPEVAEIIKNNPEYAEARYLKGFIHSGMGDYDIAIREFNKVIELDPEAGNGTVYHAKGKAELANDMCEEAAVTLSEGLRRDPDNVAMLVLKGASHARMQEPDAAFAHLDKAISLNAELADPYSYKATLLSRKFGKHVEAMELIEKALEIDPESRLANVSKVEILMDMQKWKEAFDAVNECIAKFPDTSNLGILKQKIVDESDRPITAIPPLSSSD